MVAVIEVVVVVLVVVLVVSISSGGGSSSAVVLVQCGGVKLFQVLATKLGGESTSQSVGSSSDRSQLGKAAGVYRIL